MLISVNLHSIPPILEVHHKANDETSRFIIRTVGFIYRTSRFVTKHYFSLSKRDVLNTERDVLYMENLNVDRTPHPISLKSLNNRGALETHMVLVHLFRNAKRPMGNKKLTASQAVLGKPRPIICKRYVLQIMGRPRNFSV